MKYLKRNIRKILHHISLFIVWLSCWGCMGQVALAAGDDEKEKAKGAPEAFAFLKEEQENGMFDDIISLINNTTKSGVDFLQVLGIGFLVLGLMGVGIGFYLWKNPQKQSQNKDKLIYIVVGAVFVFGGLASLLASIGDALN